MLKEFSLDEKNQGDTTRHWLSIYWYSNHDHCQYYGSTSLSERTKRTPKRKAITGMTIYLI
jgi:hypothetical protein